MIEKICAQRGVWPNISISVERDEANNTERVMVEAGANAYGHNFVMVHGLTLFEAEARLTDLIAELELAKRTVGKMAIWTTVDAFNLDKVKG